MAARRRSTRLSLIGAPIPNAHLGEGRTKHSITRASLKTSKVRVGGHEDQFLPLKLNARSVRRGDLRRNERQRARRADSGPSRDRDGTARFNPKRSYAARI